MIFQNTSTTTITTGTNNTFLMNEKHHSTSASNNHHSSSINSTTNHHQFEKNTNSALSSAINNMANLTFKEKQAAAAAAGNGHSMEMNGGSESSKIAIERHEKEKPVVKAKPKELDGYVGFANLPNQVYRKAVKKGFEFTLMVVGKCNGNFLNFNSSKSS